ncbi:hypothetical protein DPMN_071901 [Dreissena polymorpha]|uniref:Uncharacterized protein n=1 Tax=Dreissena polymorpha TaxID=45954 RepID=A0A9D4BQ23_DREPO|nr:hypothetical protein DPMN_071901 [Dreissena polymorpha]
MADLQSISNSFSSDFSNSSNFSNSINHCSRENNNSSSNQPAAATTTPVTTTAAKTNPATTTRSSTRLSRPTCQQDIIMAQLLLDITGITDASKAAKKLFRRLYREE